MTRLQDAWLKPENVDIAFLNYFILIDLKNMRVKYD
jgi:hypothetical protein